MTGNAHLDDDLLLDLVNGLLPEAERQELLTHLRSCVPCGERLRVFAAAHQRARARAAEVLAAARTEPLAVVQPIEVARRRAATRGPWRGWIAAAAAFAVVSAVLLARNSFGPASLVPVAAAPLPMPDASILTRNAAAAPMDPIVARGLAAFAHGDLADARRTLDSTTAVGAAEQVRRLFLGNAELRTGDARRAARTLRSVDASLVPEPWLGELQWSLAVALATSGEQVAADSLRQLLATRDDSIGARARAGWRK